MQNSHCAGMFSDICIQSSTPEHTHMSAVEMFLSAISEAIIGLSLSIYHWNALPEQNMNIPGGSKTYTRLMSHNTAPIASIFKIRLGLDK